MTIYYKLKYCLYCLAIFTNILSAGWLVHFIILYFSLNVLAILVRSANVGTFLFNHSIHVAKLLANSSSVTSVACTSAIILSIASHSACTL